MFDGDGKTQSGEENGRDEEEEEVAGVLGNNLVKGELVEGSEVRRQNCFRIFQRSELFLLARDVITELIIVSDMTSSDQTLI